MRRDSTCIRKILQSSYGISFMQERRKNPELAQKQKFTFEKNWLK